MILSGGGDKWAPPPPHTLTSHMQCNNIFSVYTDGQSNNSPGQHPNRTVDSMYTPAQDAWPAFPQALKTMSRNAHGGLDFATSTASHNVQHVHQCPEK